MENLKKLLNEPTIGAFIEVKNQIDNLPDYWMDFTDDKKYEIFVKTFENDEMFGPIINFLNTDDYFDLCDNEKFKKWLT